MKSLKYSLTRRRIGTTVFWMFILIVSYSCQRTLPVNNHFILTAGEAGQSSAILQCRFGEADTLVSYDIPGSACTAKFQVSAHPDFKQALEGAWSVCDEQNDYMLKNVFNGLEPGTTYYYRAIAYTSDPNDLQASVTASFSTLPAVDSEEGVSFAIATGFNYEHFHGMDTVLLRKRDFDPRVMPASGEDSVMGFEAFSAIDSLNVDFFIANGDVVYYDKPSNLKETWAVDRKGMRAKWHRFFQMPRNRMLNSSTPYFFLKDDHDHRFNDCDTTDTRRKDPPSRLGIEVFREQVPIVDPADPTAPTYRTHRAGKHLQLWFLEGRDYRSPNRMEDGPGKTIWGAKQNAWLRKTLRESDATYKLLISPTPLIGPDDAYKIDNHTNPGGFQHERDAFFAWLDSSGLVNDNFYILCGDRHWQYHSIDPTGLEEFSCGAIIDQNSRPGRLPGDPASTDPAGLLDVPFIQDETNWGGGFLLVDMSAAGGIPTLDFRFYDKTGSLRYSVLKIPTQ
jgi:alkaline phosphatase/alkaline phosphatase D